MAEKSRNSSKPFNQSRIPIFGLTTAEKIKNGQTTALT